MHIEFAIYEHDINLFWANDQAFIVVFSQYVLTGIFAIASRKNYTNRYLVS